MCIFNIHDSFYNHYRMYCRHCYCLTVKVCRRVTRDNAVDERTRMLRTKALLMLGEEYVKYAVSSEKGIAELTSKMSSVMSGKAPAENESDEDGEEALGAEAAAKDPIPPKTIDEAMSLSTKDLKEAVR